MNPTQDALFIASLAIVIYVTFLLAMLRTLKKDRSLVSIFTVLGFVLLATWMVCCPLGFSLVIYLGGTPGLGKVQNGHYFVGMHGGFREVTPQMYQFMESAIMLWQRAGYWMTLVAIPLCLVGKWQIWKKQRDRNLNLARVRGCFEKPADHIGSVGRQEQVIGAAVVPTFEPYLNALRVPRHSKRAKLICRSLRFTQNQVSRFRGHPLARGSEWSWEEPVWWSVGLLAGVGFASVGSMLNGRLFELPLVSLLFVALISWNLIMLGLRRRRRQIISARFRAFRCLRCGYDLKATPQKCPECGSVGRKVK